MKLQAILERFPWEQSFEALCREPPKGDVPPLKRAQELIEQQRNSQSAVLSRLMDSPLLETDYTDARKRREQGDQRFRLRDPAQTSRLFLGEVSQAGLILGPFGSERLDTLEPSDAALGRLLLLLSISESSPSSRAERAHDWREIVEKGAASELELPFGLVLTPMLAAAEPMFEIARDVGPESPRRLAGELTEAYRSEQLVPWVSNLLHQGALLLTAWSSGGLSGPLPDRPHEQTVVPRGAHVRDIRLVGGRKQNEDFLTEVRAISGVEAQTRFIYEEVPGRARIRAWSDKPLDQHDLLDRAVSSGTSIESLTDDTIV
jgi:hypothetical protein